MKSWCTHCKQWKPITDFSPKTRHADGSYATVLSRCKKCLAQLRHERRKNDPEWAKDIDRKDWQRISSDPVKLEKRRRLTRENGAVHRKRTKPEKQLTEDELRTRAQREQWTQERRERRERARP